jgi:hypothetical protein
MKHTSLIVFNKQFIKRIPPLMNEVIQMFKDHGDWVVEEDEVVYGDYLEMVDKKRKLKSNSEYP